MRKGHFSAMDEKELQAQFDAIYLSSLIRAQNTINRWRKFYSKPELPTGHLTDEWLAAIVDLTTTSGTNDIARAAMQLPGVKVAAKGCEIGVDFLLDILQKATPRDIVLIDRQPTDQELQFAVEWGFSLTYQPIIEA
jgi:hypothetical protein